MKALFVLALAALAAGCSSGADEANNQNSMPAGFREAVIGPISFRYDSTKLSIETVNVPLPADAERQVNGVKLLSKARVESIDQATCTDLPNNMCTAEGEGGVTLSMLNAVYAEFVAPIRRTTPTTFAGRQGVTWDGRFGGRPATFTVIPVGQQSLMLIRQAGGEGAPDAATIDTVLGTLKFEEAPAPAPAAAPAPAPAP